MCRRLSPSVLTASTARFVILVPTRPPPPSPGTHEKPNQDGQRRRRGGVTALEIKGLYRPVARQTSRSDVQHTTLNQRAQGSSPCAPTNQGPESKQLSGPLLFGQTAILQFRFIPRFSTSMASYSTSMVSNSASVARSSD